MQEKQQKTKQMCMQEQQQLTRQDVGKKSSTKLEN